MCRIKTDVVIPLYRPGTRLIQILKNLSEQTLPPEKVCLINTEKPILDRFLEDNGMDEAALLAICPGTGITHITAEEFDHAGTRNLGMRLCEGADYVIMLTQDALPAGRTFIEDLIRPLEEIPDLAVSYGRQLPNENAKEAERYSRAFNYPPEPLVKSQEDFARLGIKTYFCSDVCAAYRVSLFNELGGFTEPAIFNEDMIFAGRALQAGYRIRYTAEAAVYHSHNYSARQQFLRNFDLGVSQAKHPEIFAGASSEGEGVRYAKAVIRHLAGNGAALEVPGFVTGCAARLLGYKLGRNWEKLPKALCRKFSSNRRYWK